MPTVAGRTTGQLAACLLFAMSCSRLASGELNGANETAPVCFDCHGNSGNGNAAPPPTNWHALSFIDAHQAHLGNSTWHAPIGCEVCHIVPREVLDPGHVDSALPAELTWGVLPQSDGAVASYDAGLSTCSNYCHGQTLLPGGSNTTPQWTRVDGSQAACGTCHGLPPAPPHPANTHCSTCHGMVVDAGGGFVDPNLHINGRLDVIPLQCNTCHGSAGDPSDPLRRAPPSDTSGNNATSAAGVGAHQSHLRPADWHQQVQCSDCHIVPSGTDSAGHRDTPLPAELTFSALATHNDETQPAFDGVTCGNIYCHGATLRPGGSNNQPTWILVDSTQAACGTCHGLPPTGSHSKRTQCSDCHGEVIDANGVFVAPSRHINGVVEHGAGSPSAVCQECHGHDAGFEVYPGVFSQGAGSFRAHSTHTELDADDQRGPLVDCDTCHDVTALPTFRSGTDADGDSFIRLDETDVCNPCHSPGGAFDGVSDPIVGAKANWRVGIYEGPVPAAGKERWCAGCHDDAPANSKADGTGVFAPTITGDNVTYGFYVTGHGRDPRLTCVPCHDSASRHIDHARHDLNDVLLNGAPRSTFRLYAGKDVEIQPDPFYGFSGATLCFSCHAAAQLLEASTAVNTLQTNYRRETATQATNLHLVHVSTIVGASCIFCHEPHGTTRAAFASSRIDGYRVLSFDAGQNLYFELTDPSLWRDPAVNVGGALTSTPPCGPCHLPADLSAGVGPLEAYPDGWYLRQYRPQTFTVSNDLDGDGVDDPFDNCRTAANTDQSDIDADQVGDVCDNCPSLANADQADFDTDGVGDLCDLTCDTLAPTFAMRFGSSASDYANDVLVAADGSIFVAGSTWGSTFGPSAGLMDIIVAKYDAAGGLLWSRHVGSSGMDEATALSFGPSGTLYVSATTYGPLFDAAATNNEHPAVMRFDASGALLWGAQHSSISTGDDVVVDNLGNVYVAGGPWVLLKYDPDGNLLWTSGKRSPFYRGHVAFDSAGDIYAAGDISDCPASITFTPQRQLHLPIVLAS